MKDKMIYCLLLIISILINTFPLIDLVETKIVLHACNIGNVVAIICLTSMVINMIYKSKNNNELPIRARNTIIIVSGIYWMIKNIIGIVTELRILNNELVSKTFMIIQILLHPTLLSVYLTIIMSIIAKTKRIEGVVINWLKIICAIIIVSIFMDMSSIIKIDILAFFIKVFITFALLYSISLFYYKTKIQSEKYVE